MNHGDDEFWLYLKHERGFVRTDGIPITRTIANAIFAAIAKGEKKYCVVTYPNEDASGLHTISFPLDNVALINGPPEDDGAEVGVEFG